MADDPWKAAGFIQEQAPAAPAAPTEAPASPMPYSQPENDPNDLWAAAGLQRIQGDGSPTILPRPPVMAKQAALGDATMSAKPTTGEGAMDLGRAQLSRTLHFSPLMDSIMAGLQSVPDAMAEQLQQGAAQVQKGQQQFFQGDPGWGTLNTVGGLANALWSPVTGVAQKVGEQAMKVTGDQVFGEKTALLLSLTSPMPMKRPLITTATGDLARLHLNEAGQVDATIVGKPPTPADFHMAARSILDSSPVKVGENAEQAAMLEQKLHDYWNDQGVHPAEVAEIAKNSPAHAADLSSARTPPLPLPERPSRPFLYNLSDQLYAIRGIDTANKEEVLDKMVTDIPTPFKDGAVQHRVYGALEGDPKYTMTPEETALWNEHMQPWREEATDIYRRVKKIGIHAEDIDELDPNYITRLPVGHTPEVDAMAGMVDKSNPIAVPTGALASSTRSMHERAFFKMVSDEGDSRIIRLNNSSEGAHLETVGSLPAGGGIISHDQKEALHLGDTVSVAGKDWKIVPALTDEIEAATGRKYYHNALLSVATNLIQLRAVDKFLETMQRLKDSDEFAKYAGPDKLKPDWIRPDMPMFRNTWMEPRLAYELDDFWGGKPLSPLAEKFERANSWMIKALFWTPFPHIFNTGVNWAVARSWDWINPVAYKRLAVNGARAIHEVITLGPTYRRLQKEGAAVVYGSLANRDYYGKLAEATGAYMAKSKDFADIARELAVSPERLVAGIYNVSAKGLWSVSDMFTVQRIMELEDKGMTTSAAIKQVDKTIVNYRLPTTMVNSRVLRELYANPAAFEFSRYHWGVLRAYANIANDLYKGDMATKADAIGRVMALGAMQLMVFPALNEALNQITGNPNLQVPSFGLGRLAYPVVEGVIRETQDIIHYPAWLLKYYNHDRTMISALMTLAPISPALKMAIEGAFGVDTFTGRNIAEPSDARNMGIATPEARTALRNWVGDKAVHAAETGVEPLSLIDDAWKHGVNLETFILKHLFAIPEHPPEMEAAAQRAFHYQDVEASRRHNKPRGALESLVTGNPLPPRQ